jgi:hypothetical protein
MLKSISQAERATIVHLMSYNEYPTTRFHWLYEAIDTPVKCV